jgi:hypothetical protein
MKRKRYTDEQIAFALRQAEGKGGGGYLRQAWRLRADPNVVKHDTSCPEVRTWLVEARA